MFDLDYSSQRRYPIQRRTAMSIGGPARSQKTPFVQQRVPMMGDPPAYPDVLRGVPMSYAGERMQAPAQGVSVPPPPQAQPPWPGIGMPIDMGGPGAPAVGIGNYMVPGGMKPRLPVNNPYVTGAAPIQQRAARVQQYANSFPAAQAAGVPGGGLLTDVAAGQLYSESGYMPSTTIGGNWNRRPMGRHPLAHLSTRQQKDLMRVDANTAAYEADQASRQAALSQPMTNEQAVAFAQRSRGLEPLRGRDIDPRRMQMLIRQGVITGPDDVVGLRASTGLRDSLGERGLLGQPDQEQLNANRAAYMELRGDEIAGRRDRIEGRAAERSEGRRRLLEQRNQPQGGGDMLNALAMRDPRLALGVMQLRQQGRLAEAEMMMRQGALNLQGQEMAQRGELGRGALEIQRQEAANRASQMQLENSRYGRQDMLNTAEVVSKLQGDMQAAKDAGDPARARAIESQIAAIQGGAQQPAAPPASEVYTPSDVAEKSSAYANLEGAELFNAMGVPLDALAALGDNPSPQQVRDIAGQYGLTPDMLRKALEYQPRLPYRMIGDPNAGQGYQGFTDWASSQSNMGGSRMLPWMLFGEGRNEYMNRYRRQKAATGAMSVLGR